MHPPQYAAMRLPHFALTFALILAFGCGTVEETTTTETWKAPTPVAVTARLEYRIDSVMNENRRLRQQMDALTAENRNLSARASELETRLAEARAVPKAPPPPKDLTSGYTAALAEYRKRNFSGAASQFSSLLTAGIREDLADNCHYWLGESYYGLGKYSDALGHFEMVFNYIKSEKKDDAQMMIGNSYLAMRNTASAIAAFNKLISNYPASPYVKRAQEKLTLLK